MRVVLDSNVVISGIAFPKSTCAIVVNTCVDDHDIALSQELVEETRSALVKKFAATVSQVQVALETICESGSLYEPARIDSDACRDPKDLHVLGLAVAAHADAIVSGDQDLLVLESFRGIRIHTPAAFLDSLTK